MDTVFLHCCCGPCSTYTVKTLREHGFKVNAFWYNPNIHPFTEHEKRLESMNTLAVKEHFPLITDQDYHMVDFFRSVVGHEDDRCADCYHLRLNMAAEVARREGFKMFTTTLLISPYQNQVLLEEIGHHAAKKHGIEFYFHDLRKGFRESQQMAKDLDLYRQKYCGCIYSEWERFSKTKVK